MSMFPPVSILDPFALVDVLSLFVLLPESSAVKFPLIPNVSILPAALVAAEARALVLAATLAAAMETFNSKYSFWSSRLLYSSSLISPFSFCSLALFSSLLKRLSCFWASVTCLTASASSFAALATSIDEWLTPTESVPERWVSDSVVFVVSSSDSIFTSFPAVGNRKRNRHHPSWRYVPSTLQSVCRHPYWAG